MLFTCIICYYVLAKIFVFGKQIVDGFNVLTLKLRAEKIWLILKEIFVISRLTLFGVTYGDYVILIICVHIGRACGATLWVNSIYLDVSQFYSGAYLCSYGLAYKVVIACNFVSSTKYHNFLYLNEPERCVHCLPL